MTAVQINENGVLPTFVNEIVSKDQKIKNEMISNKEFLKNRLDNFYIWIEKILPKNSTLREVFIIHKQQPLEVFIQYIAHNVLKYENNLDSFISQTMVACGEKNIFNDAELAKLKRFLKCFIDIIKTM